ncbi:kin of IRRE-like protein 3 [Dinothrombium tinctorium]|uniref:Kin of IRRE-like protein 3 n=1 Tax=Dinothrombium tinctorium TaxID=1965070 RepID=A0A3S3PLF4_9ACAR|nr:kin of IRRE-like protein 3 [Dinothrombium tinctorium]
MFSKFASFCSDLSEFRHSFTQLSSASFEPQNDDDGGSASEGSDAGRRRLAASLDGDNNGQQPNSEATSYHLFHDKHRIEPYFDNTTARNITTSSGKTVYLPCRVHHLSDRTVSWIRRKNLHVLTVGKFTYTSDQRFQAVHLDNSDDWLLQVGYPQYEDGGEYECQISTTPKKSLFVTLNVVVTKAKIIGGPSLYINSGSTLNLTCVVNDTPGPPDFIFWYHNGEVINYIPRGIKVQTEKSAQTTSKLIISKAHPNDSGNYSCVPSNAEPAHIAVHVLNNGGNPAAMQHGKRSAAELITNDSAASPRVRPLLPLNCRRHQLLSTCLPFVFLFYTFHNLR